MSEERKTKTDAAVPASAALGRIDRKDAFLQALHTFLTAHQGTEWAVAAVDIRNRQANSFQWHYTRDWPIKVAGEYMN